MIKIDLPRSVIKTKPFNEAILQQALNEGLDPVLARIVASRALVSEIPILDALSPKLKFLTSPFRLKDMDIAAERVAKAIIEGEYIGIETDHDCDGQTSHAVLFHNLVHHFRHPKDKILSYIGHRITEGYGLSESVVNRILESNPRPSLIITADNGSSDEPRIVKLKQAGIDVIVTDHHEIPKEGIPLSALVCLNPTREDCGYGDPYIAGCMVAWLLMAATRQILMQSGYLSSDAPSLLDSLDFVAVGTIADCVSIARSVNNRAVVSYGIRIIEKGNRACWRALKTSIPSALSSEDLAFRIGPLLNSDGRLATAFGSVSFLLSETDEEAMAWLFSLQDHNAERKAIQQDIVIRGLSAAAELVQKGYSSICIYLDNSHSGVHGIAASRIKEVFGRPTAFFTPKVTNPEIITGSIRGIEGFHVRNALQCVADQFPEMLVAFGGHKGAGGVTLQLKHFEDFKEAFEAASCKQLCEQTLGPVIWTEGMLSAKYLKLEFVDILNQLEPFGREFESPVFELVGYLRDIRYMGDGTHARITLETEGMNVTGVWFKIRQTNDASIHVKLGDFVKVAFSVKANFFRGERRLDIQIHQMEEMS